MLHPFDFDAAEELQADEPRDAADHAFRRKAWIAITCGLAAFWILAAGALALVWSQAR